MWATQIQIPRHFVPVVLSVHESVSSSVYDNPISDNRIRT